MERFVKIEGDYYISAGSSYADDRTRVLNHGDTFGVFDRWGDIQPFGKEVQGLYHENTRFVSSCEFRIEGHRPLLLSSSLKESNEILTIDLTNPELPLQDEVVMPASKIHILRTKYLRDGHCYESIKLANYDTLPYSFSFSLTFASDFKDIFELRGKTRLKHGLSLPPKVSNNQLSFHYEGLDKVRRCVTHYFSPAPNKISSEKVVYRLNLAPKQVFQLQVRTGFRIGSEDTTRQESVAKAAKQAAEFDIARAHLPGITTSNEQFNHWLNRSKTDLISLVSDTPHGKYPYAGIPWFNTAFGRDGLITALETLWLIPGLSRDVLRFLAHTQAEKLDDFQDAEPGKILHETRKGEMAELGEIPYKQYYGTVDATPLFIILAGAYYRRTKDADLIQEIWPNIKAALNWIEEYGDMDGDGYLEYHKRSPNGLIHQGWKDADDAVSHADGELAITPMALCEVQGYVYAAKQAAASLAKLMKEDKLALQHQKEAKELKTHFNKDFWDKELQCFVIGLDANKKPCRVKSSNAGQCLFTGIVDEKHIPALAKTLLHESLFSGWGIRTLATDAGRYNPMSYHNGTVWPHDTALIAYGLGRCGHPDKAMKIFSALFDAAMYIELQRLPELFCGFARREGEGPTEYPVACSPQAWAVGSVFLLLKACLNIDIDALKKRVTFYKPSLPPWIDELKMVDIPLGSESLELSFTRYDKNVGINVIAKPEGWEVIEIR